MRDHAGIFSLGMKEDQEGTAVIDCTTLLPSRAPFPTEVVEVGRKNEQELEPARVTKVVAVPARVAEEVVAHAEESEVKEEEVFVAALVVKLLHKRVRHLGKDGVEGYGGASHGAGGRCEWRNGVVRRV